MATKTTKPRNKKNTPAKKKKVWSRILLFFSIKLLIVMACVFAFLYVYFDAQIEEKFAGHKWKLPVQVYSLAKVIKKGDALSRDELIQRLEILGYRSSASLDRAGQFKSHLKNSNDKIEIWRRSFTYSKGRKPRQRFSIEFKGGRVSSIIEKDKNELQKQFILEPFLVDTLQANNLEDRILVNVSQVPEKLYETLILVEDRDFYNHFGVSPMAIIRAMITNIRVGRRVQGGSTLTQQLVKNMFLTRERSFTRKFKEAFIALLLDAQYSKREILEAYMNEVFIGQNGKVAVHGFGLAARFYFGKDISELDPHEQALMIGIVKGPSYYDPRRNPERATKRRDLILRLMTEHGKITRDEYEVAVNKPLGVVPREKILTGRFPSYTKVVRQELKKIQEAEPLLHSGIQVYTHFDPLAQQRAQLAVTTQLAKFEQAKKLGDLQAAMVIVDSDTGGISAVVGDKNAGYSGFNRALNARRNIGSLIKPVIYMSALRDSKKYNLATMLKDKPISLKSDNNKRWKPKNYDGRFLGKVLLVDSLANSRNIPTVNLGMDLGIDVIAQELQILGITSNIPLYPSMLLGSIELSPLEVATVYQPIANMGNKFDLYAIENIKQNDQLVWQARSYGTQVIDDRTAYLLNFALQQTTRTGTAKWLGNTYRQARFAGKTGTTNGTKDSWFVGYDQSELAVVWLGRDNYKSTDLTGSSGALRIFGQYQRRRFPINLVTPKPDNVQMVYFNEKNGRHVSGGCENARYMPAVVRHLPKAIRCEREMVPSKSNREKQERSWLDKLIDSLL